jgi:hypothetical protein
MNTTELTGWSAAVLTLLAFTMRDVRKLRMASVAASVCFIAYGAATSAWPVLALHAVLLPMNLFRLHELRRPGRGASGPLGKCAYWLLAPVLVLVLLVQGSTETERARSLTMVPMTHSTGHDGRPFSRAVVSSLVNASTHALTLTRVVLHRWAP